MTPLANSTRTVLLLLAITIGTRVVVVGGSLIGSRFDTRHDKRAPVTVAQYAGLHDGAEYQLIAKALFDAKALRGLPDVTERLFPGYPAVIRTLSFLAPRAWSALGVVLLCAAISVVLFYRMTGDLWLSACFAVFTPSWLLYSSLAMSESLFIVLSLAGFAFWRSSRFSASAFVLGAATLVRPVGVFVFAACWLATLIHGRRKRAIAMACVYVIAPITWGVVAWHVWGDPLRQFHAYVDKDATRPFMSLVTGTLSGEIGLPKKALVWFTVATNLAAVTLLLVRYLRSRDAVSLAWLLWAALMALFFLGLPSSWAFGSLDRFFVASAPPMLVGLARFAPRRAWSFAALTVACVAVCLYWNLNMFLAAL